MKTIHVSNINISNENPYTLIAGPCVIESESLMMNTAERVKEISDKLGISFIFKSSFDKANRSSIYSYRGVGIEEGLRILEKVKSTFGIPVITDIHLPDQAIMVADVVDIIQIPAFLCRQTDLLVAAANTKKPINVKKAQFLAPWDMKNVLDKFYEAGNSNIMLCERGSTFGYNNLVVDMTSMIEMKKFNHPVIFDVTHSIQKPSSNGSSTGGNREYIKDLSKAGIALKIAGIFIETHPDPDNAPSDGPNMLKLEDLENLLSELKEIDEVVKRR